MDKIMKNINKKHLGNGMMKKQFKWALYFLLFTLHVLFSEAVWAKNHFKIYDVGLYSRVNSEGVFIADLGNNVFEVSFATLKGNGTPYHNIFTMIDMDGNEHSGQIDFGNHDCDAYGVDVWDDYYSCRTRAVFPKKDSLYKSFKLEVIGKKNPSQPEEILDVIESRLPELFAVYDQDKHCLVLQNVSSSDIKIKGIKSSEYIEVKRVKKDFVLAPQGTYEISLKLKQKALGKHKNEDFLEELLVVRYIAKDEILKNKIKVNLVSTDFLKSFTKGVQVDTPLFVEQPGKQQGKTTDVQILASGMVNLGKGRYRLELLLKNSDPEWTDIKLHLNGSVELIDQNGDNHTLKFDENAANYSDQCQDGVLIDHECKVTFEGYLEGGVDIDPKGYRVTIPYTDEFIGDNEITFEKGMLEIDIIPQLDFSPSKPDKYLLTFKNRSGKNIVVYDPYHSSSIILEKDSSHQVEIDQLDKDSEQKEQYYLFSYATQDEPDKVKTVLVPIMYIGDLNKKWWHWDRYGWKIAAGVVNVAVIVAAVYFGNSQATESSLQPVLEKPANWMEDWAMNTWGKRFKQTLKIGEELFNTPYSLTSDPDYKTNPDPLKQTMQKLFVNHQLELFYDAVEYDVYRDAVHKVTIEEIQKLILKHTGQSVGF